MKFALMNSSFLLWEKIARHMDRWIVKYKIICLNLIYFLEYLWNKDLDVFAIPLYFYFLWHFWHQISAWPQDISPSLGWRELEEPSGSVTSLKPPSAQLATDTFINSVFARQVLARRWQSCNAGWNVIVPSYLLFFCSGSWWEKISSHLQFTAIESIDSVTASRWHLYES